MPSQRAAAGRTNLADGDGTIRIIGHLKEQLALFVARFGTNFLEDGIPSQRFVRSVSLVGGASFRRRFRFGGAQRSGHLVGIP